MLGRERSQSTTSTKHVPDGTTGLMLLLSPTVFAETRMAIPGDVLVELDAYRGGRYPQILKLRKYIHASRRAGVTWNSLCLELSLPRTTSTKHVVDTCSM